MYPDIFKNGDFFFPRCSLPFSGTKNASFRKRFPERSLFENASLSFSCARTKMKVSEYDDVVHHTAQAI